MSPFLQDFREPEPDPWSVSMPVPIIGYMLSCAQGQCHVDDATDMLANLPGGKVDLQRYRSLSDTKLHRINKCVNKSVFLAQCASFFPPIFCTQLQN